MGRNDPLRKYGGYLAQAILLTFLDFMKDLMDCLGWATGCEILAFEIT